MLPTALIDMLSTELIEHINISTQDLYSCTELNICAICYALFYFKSMQVFRHVCPSLGPFFPKGSYIFLINIQI